MGERTERIRPGHIETAFINLPSYMQLNRQPVASETAASLCNPDMSLLVHVFRVAAWSNPWLPSSRSPVTPKRLRLTLTAHSVRVAKHSQSIDRCRANDIPQPITRRWLLLQLAANSACVVNRVQVVSNIYKI